MESAGAFSPSAPAPRSPRRRTEMRAVAGRTSAWRRRWAMLMLRLCGVGGEDVGMHTPHGRSTEHACACLGTTPPGDSAPGLRDGLPGSRLDPGEPRPT